MYRREVDGRVLEFDHCGYVYQGSFVMFDKQTESEWLHMTAECVMGPLKGKSLDVEPARLMTWRQWKALHPQTTVMVTRRKWSSASLEKKDFAKAASRPKLGLNVVVEHESKLYPYSLLEPAKVINDRFQETPLAAVYAPQAACAVAWVRRVGDRELTLRPQPVSGDETASGNRERLRLRDEQTGSLWDPLSGKAISDPLKGKQLSPLVAIPIRISRYPGLYPDGQVPGGVGLHDGHIRQGNEGLELVAAPGRFHRGMPDF